MRDLSGRNEGHIACVSTPRGQNAFGSDVRLGGAPHRVRQSSHRPRPPPPPTPLTMPFAALATSRVATSARVMHKATKHHKKTRPKKVCVCARARGGSGGARRAAAAAGVCGRVSGARARANPWRLRGAGGPARAPPPPVPTPLRSLLRRLSGPWCSGRAHECLESARAQACARAHAVGLACAIPRTAVRSEGRGDVPARRRPSGCARAPAGVRPAARHCAARQGIAQRTCLRYERAMLAAAGAPRDAAHPVTSCETCADGTAIGSLRHGCPRAHGHTPRCALATYVRVIACAHPTPRPLREFAPAAHALGPQPHAACLPGRVRRCADADCLRCSHHQGDRDHRRRGARGCRVSRRRARSRTRVRPRASILMRAVPL